LDPRKERVCENMAKPKVWARRLGGSLGGKLVGEIERD
jgi:hypothetical protein